MSVSLRFCFISSYATSGRGQSYAVAHICFNVFFFFKRWPPIIELRWFYAFITFSCNLSSNRKYPSVGALSSLFPIMDPILVIYRVLVVGALVCEWGTFTRNWSDYFPFFAAKRRKKNQRVSENLGSSPPNGKWGSQDSLRIVQWKKFESWCSVAQSIVDQISLYFFVHASLLKMCKVDNYSEVFYQKQYYYIFFVYKWMNHNGFH